MSYVVLARKWRPQRFSDLTGQEHIARTLTHAIERNRVPHAMLFAGARGVGKTSSARIVAMALNCFEGPTPSPCGQCDACREIQQSRSVDVLEIDGASNRSISDVRELRESVRYAPQRDRYKIFIIDEVHMLTNEAFNALLKTLEEPPPHVVFLFATTEAQKIPITILSRCQRFDFRRITFHDTVERLRFIASEEGLDIEDDVFGLIARQASGGMRDALSLLDQLISFSEGRLEASAAQQLLGAADRTHFFRLSEAVLHRDPERALRTLEELATWGADMAWVSKEWLVHLRDLTVVGAVKDARGLTALTERELAEAQRQAALVPRQHLHQIFDRMAEASDKVARSTQPRWQLEMALLQLCALEAVAPIDDLVAQLRAIADGRKLPPPSPAGTGPQRGGPGAAQSAPSGAGAAGESPASTRANARESGETGPEPPRHTTPAEVRPNPNDARPHSRDAERTTPTSVGMGNPTYGASAEAAVPQGEAAPGPTAEPEAQRSEPAPLSDVPTNEPVLPTEPSQIAPSPSADAQESGSALPTVSQPSDNHGRATQDAHAPAHPAPDRSAAPERAVDVLAATPATPAPPASSAAEPTHPPLGAPDAPEAALERSAPDPTGSPEAATSAPATVSLPQPNTDPEVAAADPAVDSAHALGAESHGKAVVPDAEPTFDFDRWRDLMHQFGASGTDQPAHGRLRRFRVLPPEPPSERVVLTHRRHWDPEECQQALAAFARWCAEQNIALPDFQLEMDQTELDEEDDLRLSDVEAREERTRREACVARLREHPATRALLVMWPSATVQHIEPNLQETSDEAT